MHADSRLRGNIEVVYQNVKRVPVFDCLDSVLGKAPRGEGIANNGILIQGQLEENRKRALRSVRGILLDGGHMESDTSKLASVTILLSVTQDTIDHDSRGN